MDKDKADSSQTSVLNICRDDFRFFIKDLAAHQHLTREWPSYFILSIKNINFGFEIYIKHDITSFRAVKVGLDSTPVV